MADWSELSEALLVLADQIERDNLPVDVVLSRLDDVFEIIGMITALQDVSIDDAIVDSLRAIEHRVRVENTQAELLSNVGRPRLDIPPAALKTLVLSGITIGDIANMFAVSPSTVRRRMAEEGLR